MIAHNSKPIKLRNVYTIRNTARNVTIQKRNIFYIKIKVIAFFINFRRTNLFAIERCNLNLRGLWYLLYRLCSTIVKVDELNLIGHTLDTI